MTQREQNPFEYSDSNKRYHTFDYYMKHRFGGKCARVPLDAGFTCPNKDGTKGTGGCIFCFAGSAANGGSRMAGTGEGRLLQSGGECTADNHSIKESLTAQYLSGIEAVRRKWKISKFIPYLQANTNTYAPPEVLRHVLESAAGLPDAVMLALGTRADCLPEPVLGVLREASAQIPLLVELGLQSFSDETARRINRCHTAEDFIDGYRRLRAAVGDITVCVHLINGLPGETPEMMIQSAERLAALRPDMVKIHLLQVMRGTALYKMYESGEYIPMDREKYIETTCRQLELFAPETVIARITGDAPEKELVAPLWSRRKTSVSNDIDKKMFNNNTYQGKQMSTSKIM